MAPKKKDPDFAAKLQREALALGQGLQYFGPGGLGFSQAPQSMAAGAQPLQAAGAPFLGGQGMGLPGGTPVLGAGVLSGTRQTPPEGAYSEQTGRGDPPPPAPYQPGAPISAGGGGSATSTSQQTSTSVTEGQLKPEYELGIKTASERQQELEIQKADQAALAAKVLGIKSRISIAQREMRVNDMRRQQLQRQDKLLAETTKLNRAYEAWGKKEVDQDRAWKKMTKGNVWAAAALGALAGAWRYDPQTKSYKPGNGWAMIERTIDRDIAAQKDQLGREGQALGAKRGLLGELRAIYKDQDQADLAHEAKTWDMAADTLKAWSAEMKTPQLQMEGLLNAQKAKQTANMKLAQLTQKKITTTQTATVSRRAGGGAGAKVTKAQREAGQESDTANYMVSQAKKLRSAFTSNPIKVATGLGKEGRLYSRQARELGVALWKQIDSGRLSDQDVILAVKTYTPPGRWAVDVVAGGRQAGQEMLTTLVNRLETAAARNQTYNYTPAQKARLKAMVAKKFGLTGKK